LILAPVGSSAARVSIDTAFIVSAKLSLFEGFDLLDSVALVDSARIMRANFFTFGYFSHRRFHTCSFINLNYFQVEVINTLPFSSNKKW